MRFLKRILKHNIKLYIRILPFNFLIMIKVILTRKQIETSKQLVVEMLSIINLKIGSITDIKFFHTKNQPNLIVVFYQKLYLVNGQPKVEFPIISINEEGQMERIDNNFSDIFKRVAFLNECFEFDIKNNDTFSLAQ